METKTDYPTGVCVCLILGDKRSLHACIGAAHNFSVEFFETDEWKTKISEYNKSDEVSLFYVEGYFIPGREDVIKYILNKYTNRHVVHEMATTENITDDVKLDHAEKTIKAEEPIEIKKEVEIVQQTESEPVVEKGETGEQSNTSAEAVKTEESPSSDVLPSEKSETTETPVDNTIETVKTEVLEPIIEEVKNSEEKSDPVQSAPPATQASSISPPKSPGVKNLFATNLNAAYIVKEYSETVKLLVESADLIFGNREEFEALATIYEGCQTIQDVVQLLMRKEAELDRLKIFVITDGQDPVAVYYGTDNDFRWHRYRVPSMPSERVRDTTGAGDSFIAGFLHKFMNKGLLADCVANGCDIAGQVVQNIGCNLI